MRYDQAEVVPESGGGRRTLSQTLLPSGERLRRGPTVRLTAEAGERLDLVASRLLGDPRMWWAVARASGLPGDGLSVPFGTELVVPTDPSDVGDAIRETNR